MLKRRTIYTFFKSSITNVKKKYYNSNDKQTLSFYISEHRRLNVPGLLTTFTGVTVQYNRKILPYFPVLDGYIIGLKSETSKNSFWPGNFNRRINCKQSTQ